jgi:hypothetical protein
MKRSILAIFILISTGTPILAQNTEIKGNPVVEIFADFHLDAVNDTSLTGFGLNRAYFGYKFLADKNFSSTLTVDIGTPEDLAIGSVPRRYAHFREASIGYTTGNLNLIIGITGTKIFNYQQKFWGKRYLAKTYQSINGYGYVADLGFVADYKINEIFDFDITIMNGEGYSNVQLDNSIKPSAGLTITPVKSLAFRAYTDLMMVKGLWQSTIVCFAGYKIDLFTVGAEVSYKSNLDIIQGHNAWGFSSTAAISLSKKIEFFTRYDYSTSSEMPGDEDPWNINRDGQFMINGFQYTFNNFVKIALDNQARFPADKTRTITDLIFINAMFKF